MATTIGKLNFMVSADGTGVQRGLQTATKSIQSFAGSVQAQIAALVGGAGLAGLVGWGVKLAADAEDAKVSFTAMLKSGTLAKDMLAELKQMAKATPFEFTGLRESAQTLIGMGVAAGDVLPTLNMLGDISAGSGKDLKELSLIYGQVSAAGRLMTQDMNQLATAGIPIIEALKNHFGLMGADAGKALRDMVQNGDVSAEIFKEVMRSMTTEGGLYFNLMEERSKTLSGRFSTLMDSVKELGTAVGEKLLPAMKGLTEIGIGVIDWLNGLDAGTVQATVQIVAMTAAFGAAVAIVPRIVAAGKAIVATLRAIALGQSIAQALSGPKGWATLAIGLAAAAGAGLAVNAMFSDVGAETDKVTAKVQQTTAAVKALVDGEDAADAGKGLKAKLKGIKEEAKEVEKRFDKMRRAIEGTKNESLTGAVERFTAEGFAAQFQGAQEGMIQRELEKLHDMEVKKLEEVRRQTEAVEAAIKDQKINVKEARI